MERDVVRFLLVRWKFSITIWHYLRVVFRAQIAQQILYEGIYSSLLFNMGTDNSDLSLSWCQSFHPHGCLKCSTDNVLPNS
jgi:hypothetical protein